MDIEEKIKEIEEEIKELEKRLAELEKEVPGISHGAIVEKYIKCGRDWCKNCPHGPYYYLVIKENGKVKTKYLGNDRNLKTLARKAKLIKNKIKMLQKTKRKLLEALNY